MVDRVITSAYLLHAQKHLDAIVADGSVTPELSRMAVLLQGMNFGMISRGQTGNFLEELRKELVSIANQGSPQARADVSASIVIIDEMLAHPDAHILAGFHAILSDGETVEGDDR